jgi:hypothetical protein
MRGYTQLTQVVLAVRLLTAQAAPQIATGGLVCVDDLVDILMTDRERIFEPGTFRDLLGVPLPPDQGRYGPPLAACDIAAGCERSGRAPGLSVGPVLADIPTGPSCGAACG